MDKCFASIHLCRVRVTRLDQVGHPLAGPNNMYVSDKPLQLGMTPEIEAGQDKTLVGGCDCIVASYRGRDKLKRWGLELDLATIEPALLAMLIGATEIADAGDTIGLWWPQQLDCAADPQPNVAFEAWTDAWEDDHPADTPFRYIHWIWPSSFWQIAAQTLQNDFMQPKINGFSRGNAVWGEGIYGDQPEAAPPLGGFFWTDTIPDAACGAGSHAIT